MCAVCTLLSASSGVFKARCVLSHYHYLPLPTPYDDGVSISQSSPQTLRNWLAGLKMPVYKGQLAREEGEGEGEQILHVFDYGADEAEERKGTYRKQLIAQESGIYVGRRTVGSSPGLREKLAEGKEFQAHVVKCPGGSYDYVLKAWDVGRVAPPEEHYPKEDEEMAAVVIDRSGDFLTVACGPNVAFTTKKSFLTAGVDPDDLSLPFYRLKVRLSKSDTRPAEIPLAAWEARPTQVSKREQRQEVKE
ncbi:uncharacterized protein LOC119592949 [Penaeus monodon]|uniref:uncharacterized protein LOC119592949 n=1 Tax=Penaeus monodon TaxID=6687 RepID=UPI0018A7DB92|nr:uncharacterized protein LOC119592949 [Penaeus monodon]